MGKLAALLLLFCTITAFGQRATDEDGCPGILLSEVYEHLEEDSAQTRRWVQDQTARTLAKQAASPSYANVKFLVRKVFNAPARQGAVALSDGRILERVYQGTDKGVEVRLIDRRGRPRVLISSKVLSRQKRRPISIWEALLSPDESRVVVVLATDGSTDDFEFAVYNLKKHRLQPTGIVARNPYVVWHGDEHFLYENLQGGLTRFSVRHGTESTWALEGDIVTWDAEVGLVQKKEQSILIDGENEYELPIPARIVGVSAQKIFLYTEGDAGTGMIVSLDRLALRQGYLPELQMEVPEHAYPVKKVFYDRGSLFVLRFDGQSRRLFVYKKSRQVHHTIAIPDCCSVSDVAWKTPGKTLELTFSSEIIRQRSLFYSLKKERFNEDPEIAMMKGIDGSLYESKRIEVEGHDGVRIPVRLVCGKGMLDHNEEGHPVLVASYAGFNQEGFFFPTHHPMLEIFLSRGGVFVAPALRGGNEVSKSWWKSVRKHEKTSTFSDLESVVEALIEQKIAHPKKVISMGTSNGGLTVAAASLRRPDLFGLTIPINGVLDMFGRERLDEDFEGWGSEYGNPEDDGIARVLHRYSPVELAGGAPAQNFLVVNGAHDTRVHPAHSYKLVKALQDNKQCTGVCSLVSLNRSGHWLESPLYDHHAMDAQTAIWTAIFNFLGWKY